MKIKRIISQSRRDFTAVFECEHCAAESQGHGYDDDNFHRNVIPKMKCEACGEVSPAEYRPLGTKYSEDQVV